MIKGVNRKIIEISGMENDYFEKAVLYVRPDKSEISETRLGLEARAALGTIVPHDDKRNFCEKMCVSPFVLRFAAVIAALTLMAVIAYIIFC